MGITDRKYMSEPSRSFGSIRGHDITAVLLLIFVNIAVWLVWQFARQSLPLAELMNAHFTSSPSGILSHYFYHTLLTSAISQKDTYHLLFNMLFLWYLGRDVETFYGRNNFVALYLFSGLVSSVAQIGLEYSRQSDAQALGASGAIMGVAAAAAFIDPRKKLLIWGILPIELWMLVPVFVLLDFGGVLNKSDDNIAHAAHIGGAFAGALFYALDLRPFASNEHARTGLLNRIGTWWRRRQFRVVENPRPSVREDRPERDAVSAEKELVAARKVRTVKLEPVLRETERRTPTVERDRAADAAKKSIDAETAQRVDELLAKISKEGIGGLTLEEREFLKRSSEKYKR